MSIGIVGGGCSGLLSLFECHRVGLSATVYECSTDVGGIWSRSQYPCGVHDSTQFNTSAISSSFETLGDTYTLFEFLQERCEGRNFATADDIQSYLKYWIAEEKLMESVQLGCVISRVEVDQERNCCVVIGVDESGREFQAQHSKVIIATGRYTTPIIPSFPGLTTQHDGLDSNRVVHSMDWDPLSGRPTLSQSSRLLLVGSGSSGGEVVCDTLQACPSARIYWSVTRRPSEHGVWALPRYQAGGRPCDENYSRLAMSLPAYVIQWKLSKMFYPLHVPYPGAKPSMNRDIFTVMDIPLLMSGLQTGQITLVPAINTFTQHNGTYKVDFDNGSSIDVDDIVMATGYTSKYPTIPGMDMTEELPLYRCQVPKDPQFRRIGFVSTTKIFGSVLPVAQLEARWLLHQWREGDLHRKEFSPSDALSVKYRYCPQASESLAKDLSLTPRVWSRLLSPRVSERSLGLALLLGPWGTHQYCLDGDNKRWAAYTVRVAQHSWGKARFSRMFFTWNSVYLITLGILMSGALWRIVTLFL